MTATYAWRIDTDHLADPGEQTTVGITGPSDAPADLLARLAAGETPDRGYREDDGTLCNSFGLADGDGVLYYQGRILHRTGPVGVDINEDGFEPLDDFGRPDSGCTSIQYRNEDNVWTEL